MPKGPNGQKRPADVIGNAIHVARIATGEESEAGPFTPKGVNGGKARARALTELERQAIAKKAAAKRWGKDSPVPAEKERS